MEQQKCKMAVPEFKNKNAGSQCKWHEMQCRITPETARAYMGKLARTARQKYNGMANAWNNGRMDVVEQWLWLAGWRRRWIAAINGYLTAGRVHP